MVWEGIGGGSLDRRRDLSSDSVSGGATHHLFGEMPSHQEATASCVLCITVSHVLYPVTKEVLHQILDVYGVEKMSMFERGNHVEAMVQLQSWQEAKRARDAFHGRCIYEGCCFLDILLVQPTLDSGSTTTTMAQHGAEASALATEVVVDARSSPSDTHPAGIDEPKSEPVSSPSPDWDWEAMSDEQKDRCLRMVTELNETLRNVLGWSTPSPTLCDAQVTSTVNAPPVMVLQQDTVLDGAHSSDLTFTPSGATANYADYGNELNRRCLEIGPVQKMAVSPIGKLLAEFAHDGRLLVIPTDFSRIIFEYKCDSALPPDQIAWCGLDSVLLYWFEVLLMVCPNGDPVQYNYDEPIKLIPECDGVRILSNSSMEFLHRVLDSTTLIFGIGSMSPATLLHDARDHYDKQSAKAYDNYQLISSFLPEAIEACMNAAGHEFDVSHQHTLLRAAAYGQDIAIASVCGIKTRANAMSQSSASGYFITLGLVLKYLVDDIMASLYCISSVNKLDRETESTKQSATCYAGVLFLSKMVREETTSEHALALIDMDGRLTGGGLLLTHWSQTVKVPAISIILTGRVRWPPCRCGPMCRCWVMSVRAKCWQHVHISGDKERMADWTVPFAMKKWVVQLKRGGANLNCGCSPVQPIWENFNCLLSYETNVMPYESDSNKVTLVVSLEDTGIGIPLHARDRVFAPFMQTDSSTSRNYGGTGIGLNISKCLVDLMDGQINFVSSPHVGSTFTFTAVFKRGDRNAISDSKPSFLHPLHSSFKGLSALLVDRRPVSATVTKDHLQRLGIASEVVDTIEIALGGLSGRNGSSLTSMHRRQPSMLLIESDSWSSKMHVPLHTKLLEMKQNGRICIAMKFYEGSIGDKRARLKGGRLPLSDILRYGVDMARGVLDLHSRGILILNLKPCKFLLDEHNRAVLGNFGSSSLLFGLPQPDPDLIRRLGTPNYMAPEQWQPNIRGPISYETDSWGFACSILEMLSGTQPWRGKSPDEVYQLVVLKKERPIFLYNLPAEVVNVLSGCFEYDFRDRPLMSDILHAFESAKDTQTQMVEAYCVGQLVRLKANISSPRFEWQRKRDGGLATGQISQILTNGCLVVRFPGKFSLGEVCSCLADPSELEAVSSIHMVSSQRLGDKPHFKEREMSQTGLTFGFRSWAVGCGPRRQEGIMNWDYKGQEQETEDGIEHYLALTQALVFLLMLLFSKPLSLISSPYLFPV